MHQSNKAYTELTEKTTFIMKDMEKINVILANMPADNSKISEYYSTLEPEVYELCMQVVGFKATCAHTPGKTHNMHAPMHASR